MQKKINLHSLQYIYVATVLMLRTVLDLKDEKNICQPLHAS